LCRSAEYPCYATVGCERKDKKFYVIKMSIKVCECFIGEIMPTEQLNLCCFCLKNNLNFGQ